MEIDKIKNISIRKRKNSQFCEKWCSGGWAWTRPAAVRVVRWTTSATREPLQHISVFGYSSILIIIIYRKNFIIITIILIVIVVGNRITIYYSEGIKIQKKSELPIDWQLILKIPIHFPRLADRLWRKSASTWGPERFCFLYEAHSALKGVFDQPIS